MKFKKSFVIILTILLCFTMYQKPKKVEAFDFVITPTILWVLGSLVVSTGIVALNYEQVLDMGQRVADKVGNINDYIEEQKIKLTVDLLTKVLEVATDIPSQNVSSPIFIPSLSDRTFNYTFSSDNEVIVNKFNLQDFYNSSPYPEFKVINNTDSSIASKLGSFNWSVGSMTSFTVKPINVYVNETKKSIYGYVWINTLTGFVNGNYYQRYGEKSENIVIPSTLNLSSENSIDIPYSNPLVRENYGPDVLPSNVPFGDKDTIGVVNVPSTIPNVSISADTPYDWDIAKDTIDYGTIPNDVIGEIDTPIDTPIEDVPGTDIPESLSLWGWLKALLMALLNVLKGILDAIKSILEFITNFFSNLIKALLGFITSLFTVSDSYFIDKFNGFKNDFSSKLNYDSYLDFIDFGYSSNSIKDITVNFFGQNIVIVRFSLFERFRGSFNTFVYAIMFFLLAMYNYNQVYKIIRSVDLTNPSSPSQFQIDLQASRKNKNLGG